MTDRPPEAANNLVITASGCGGRAIGFFTLTVVVLAGVLILLPKLFSSDDVIPDTSEPVAGSVEIGRPFVTPLPPPTDEVELLTVTPIQLVESAPAIVDVLACGDVGQEVARTPGLRALRQACPTPVPTPGIQVGPDDELVLVVTPLAAGEVRITAVDVTRSDGWRHVTESIGVDVVITGTEPGG